ncbi:hypothetical protein U9R62_06780 [Cylindrospermopsis raciborskii DSH]|uniref:hypothetical protein n=1 Tax=Cylindrospermopsis raciborskii TaxID=77022 RepID=UPI002ED9B7E1
MIELEDLLGQLDPESPSFQLVSTSGAAIDIPTPVFNLMQQMVHELLQGNSVTIVPIHKELTTQEAADILNVSRQYLVELPRCPNHPPYQSWHHRRIRFGNLMHYKTERDAKRQTGLSWSMKSAAARSIYRSSQYPPRPARHIERKQPSPDEFLTHLFYFPESHADDGNF